MRALCAERNKAKSKAPRGRAKGRARTCSTGALNVAWPSRSRCAANSLAPGSERVIQTFMRKSAPPIRPFRPAGLGPESPRHLVRKSAPPIRMFRQPLAGCGMRCRPGRKAASAGPCRLGKCACRNPAQSLQRPSARREYTGMGECACHDPARSLRPLPPQAGQQAAAALAFEVRRHGRRQRSSVAAGCFGPQQRPPIGRAERRPQPHSPAIEFGVGAQRHAAMRRQRKSWQ